MNIIVKDILSVFQAENHFYRGVFRLKNKILILVMCIFMVVVTALAVFTSYKPRYEIQFDPETVNPENVQKFEEVRKLLRENYYQDVDENTLLEGAVAGMAGALGDPYTVYFTKEQMKSFMERSDGSYVGIGVTVVMDDNGLLTVIEPFEGSPAKSAGILQGDKIIRVDDEDVSTIRDEDMIINKIKGVADTKVKITVYRPSVGNSFDFEMVRKRIKITNISSEVLDDKIGYIKIVMFDSEIGSYFEESLNRLLEQGIRGLIVDVRDNPGGAYDEVVKIADRLLPEGMIVYTEDRNGKGDVENSDENGLELPMAVLINGNSASASEILAGSIKDNNKGALIGTRTFGKGLVQAVLPLKDGSGLKVTVSTYYTPSGVSIQGTGIEPNEIVELPEKYRNVPVSQIPRADDIQLQTAIQVLKAVQQ